MGTYNFSFFQIPHAGIEATNNGIGAQMSRGSNERISNFGALSYGVRSSVDYTKVTTGFKSKDELQNPAIPAFYPTGNAGNWGGGGVVNNPYIVDSTTHKTRHDEFNVMTLGSRNSMGVEQPAFDTMDTSLVWNTVSGTTVSGLAANFPTEGWKTFGGRTGGPFGYEV